MIDILQPVLRSLSYRTDDFDDGEYRQCGNLDCRMVFFAEWDDDDTPNFECPHCNDSCSEFIGFSTSEPEVGLLIALQQVDDSDEIIDSLTNFYLALFLIWHLNQHHHGGGTSSGRSIPNVCLESARFFLPDYPVIVDEEDSDFYERLLESELLREAQRRVGCQLVLMETEYSPISTLSDEILAKEYLFHMKVWYIKDRQHKDPLYSQDQLAQAIYNLIPLPYNKARFSPEELHIELVNRRLDRLENEQSQP